MNGRNHPRARRENNSTLAARRIAAGLTQEQLAAKLGVSPATVQRWELGMVPVKPLVLTAINAALDEENNKKR